MQESEVYPNPPIVHTAVEVKHDRCEPLNSGQRAVVSQLLREALPLAEEDRSIEFELRQQDGDSSPVPHTLELPVYLWLSRDRRTAATFQIDGLHAPIRLAFEELITDRLRNEVLRHG